ncbi:MAG: hypothetical protein ACI8T1_000464 [Verrucomicrobiales bacterium]|jgi:hypothetical protein
MQWMKSWTLIGISVALSTLAGNWAQRLTTREGDVSSASVESTTAETQATEENQSSAPPLPRPSIDALIAADAVALRKLLARFLPAATTDELEILSEHHEFEVDLNMAPVICWRMLLAHWVELDSKRALAVEKTLDDWSLKGWCYNVWSWQKPLEALAAAEADSISAIR